MSMNPIVTHYWDHHKAIKAIEKSSLQATFGPEITSTTDLVPQKIQVPSGITFKANNENKIAPVEERTRSNRIPLLLAKPQDGLLPIDPLKEGGDIAPDLIAKKNGRKNGKHVTPTNRRRNIPSELFTSGSNMPAVSTFENGTTPVVQSDLLGQVPLETWDQKVSYHARTLLLVTFADISPTIRLKNFEFGPAHKGFLAISTIYLTQITSIQTTTVSGTRGTSSALVAPRTP